MPSQIGITLAGLLLQFATIYHSESSAAFAYRATFIQNTNYAGDVGALNAQHFRNELLRQMQTFDAVQASLAANAIARKAKSKATPFLLAGYLFDSAGNRMTPSHNRKKGVRYRYYVSQAVLQSRKEEAGEIFRAPAPDIEALVGRFLRDYCQDQQTDLRSPIEA